MRFNVIQPGPIKTKVGSAVYLWLLSTGEMNVNMLAVMSLGAVD